jgi:hypothetical protein
MTSFSTVSSGASEVSEFFDAQAASAFQDADQIVQQYQMESKIIQTCMAEIEHCLSETRKKYPFSVKMFLNRAQKELSEKVHHVACTSLTQPRSEAFLLAEVFSQYDANSLTVGEGVDTFFEKCSAKQLEAYLYLCKNKVLTPPESKHVGVVETSVLMLYIPEFVNFVLRFKKEKVGVEKFSVKMLDDNRDCYKEQEMACDFFLCGAAFCFSNLFPEYASVPHHICPEPIMFVRSWSVVCPYLTTSERSRFYALDLDPRVQEVLFKTAKDLGVLDQDIASLPLSLIPTKFLKDYLQRFNSSQALDAWFAEEIQTDDGRKTRFSTMSQEQKDKLSKYQ